MAAGSVPSCDSSTTPPAGSWAAAAPAARASGAFMPVATITVCGCAEMAPATATAVSNRVGPDRRLTLRCSAVRSLSIFGLSASVPPST
ncbi:hypothetical protein ABIA35_000661 [Catenulispora sp. MAP12-49]